MAKSFEEQLDSYPEGWRPQPGDKVIGTIVEIDTRTSDYGQGDYPVLTIALDSGEEVAVHAFHTVLKNELARLKPVEGERIGIVYHGKKAGKGGGNGYESYRVKVDRSAGGSSSAPDWDAMKAETDQQLGNEAPPAQTVEPAKPDPTDDVPF